jgi:hypothetical protein
MADKIATGDNPHDSAGKYIKRRFKDVGGAWAEQTWSADVPAEHAFAITPDDDEDLPSVTRGLYVGVSGHIKMTMAGGEVVTRKNVAAGMTHPWSVKRIWSTGTTATDMIGDY